MKRGPYAKVGARNHDLLASIRRIKADHPFWGYRRVWAYVCYMEQQMVTQKRIYRFDEVTRPAGAPQSAAQSQPRGPSPKTQAYGAQSLVGD